MMHLIRWRWGFWLHLWRLKIGVLGPSDPVLFSERSGSRRPLLRLGAWRLFVERKPKQWPRIVGPEGGWLVPSEFNECLEETP